MLEGVTPIDDVPPCVHVLIHYAEAAKKFGVLKWYWLMSFERFNKKIKRIVGNKTCPISSLKNALVRDAGKNPSSPSPPPSSPSPPPYHSHPPHLHRLPHHNHPLPITSPDPIAPSSLSSPRHYHPPHLHHLPLITITLLIFIITSLITITSLSSPSPPSSQLLITNTGKREVYQWLEVHRTQRGFSVMVLCG